MDIWSKKKRSDVMSKIRGKNTKPETILRSRIFKEGYRYRLHRKDLPGKPDIILPKYNTVIFVHGCFWHYHKDCREGRIPSTNSKYWKKKLEQNVKRDKFVSMQLWRLGWKVLTFWECEVETDVDRVINKIIKKLI